MPPTDDRRDKSLPVTGEVGSEGGSYADPTHRAATFGNATQPQRADSHLHSGALGDHLDFESVREGGVGTAPDPNSGMIRYPTEPPAPPSAREGWKARPRWPSIAAGAAAGAAGAAIVMLLRRRGSGPQGRGTED